MLPLRAGGEATGEQFLSADNQLQWLAQIMARHRQNRLVEIVGAQNVPGPLDCRALDHAGIRRGDLWVPHILCHRPDPSARGGATSFASGHPAGSAIEHAAVGMRLERRQFSIVGRSKVSGNRQPLLTSGSRDWLNLTTVKASTKPDYYDGGR